MGQYDFTTVADRRDTGSLKWDPIYLEKLCGNPHALPFWVADMDFRSPPEVIEALHSRIDHGIFGYLSSAEELFHAFCSWVRMRFSWDVPADAVCWTPGIVTALAASVQAYTEPGDGVIIQTPAYRPFFSVIRDNQRKVLENPLIYRDGRFSLDLDHLEELMKSASLMLFCSPHNPSGRVWSRQDITEISRMARKHGVMVVSDEIHADMTYPGYTHIPWNSIDEQGITCMAPSKTFNIAGEHVSCIVIPDEAQRKSFTSLLSRLSLGSPTVLSYTAATAAYQHGGPWLDELIDLLVRHARLTGSYLSSHAPEIRLVMPEASFIAFLDCSTLLKRIGRSRDLVNILGTRGGIALHRGSWFGSAGKDFVRINFGTPESLLEQGLSKLARAVGEL